MLALLGMLGTVIAGALLFGPSPFDDSDEEIAEGGAAPFGDGDQPNDGGDILLEDDDDPIEPAESEHPTEPVEGGQTTNTAWSTTQHDQIYGQNIGDNFGANMFEELLFQTDAITGSEGSDSLNGGDAEDLMFGNGGDDTMQGGDNADRLQGDGGDDQLSGDNGADYIEGGRGNDVIFGGTNADTIKGGGGNSANASPKTSSADMSQTDFAKFLESKVDGKGLISFEPTRLKQQLLAFNSLLGII